MLPLETEVVHSVKVFKVMINIKYIGDELVFNTSQVFSSHSSSEAFIKIRSCRFTLIELYFEIYLVFC